MWFCSNDEGGDEDVEANGSNQEEDEEDEENDGDRTIHEVEEKDSLTSASAHSNRAHTGSATSETLDNSNGDLILIPTPITSTAATDAREHSTCAADLERCVANLSLDVSRVYWYRICAASSVAE